LKKRGWEKEKREKKNRRLAMNMAQHTSASIELEFEDTLNMEVMVMELDDAFAISQ
jgi:hypothetical protein